MLWHFGALKCACNVHACTFRPLLFSACTCTCTHTHTHTHTHTRALALQGVSNAAEPLDEASLAAPPEDMLEPAGTIQSVLDDVVVVQGLANSRPLTEG